MVPNREMGNLQTDQGHEDAATQEETLEWGAVERSCCQGLFLLIPDGGGQTGAEPRASGVKEQSATSEARLQIRRRL